MSSLTTVYVIGAAGQLGTALLRSPAVPGGATVRGLGSTDVDITSAASVDRALADLRAGDVVINAAAFTDVDRAETAPEDAYAVNADGAGNLARAAARAAAELIHVSTDYVFASAAPHRPLEPDDLADDARAATVYGSSKRAGERAVLAAHPAALIVRTAWVFTGVPPVRDFVTTMTRLAADGASPNVVDDQRGSPTYAPDLAAGLWELTGHLIGGRSVERRVLHGTNAGEATWCDLARAVFAAVGADPDRVNPCTTAEFPRPAARPAYSVLSNESWLAAGLTPLRDWRAALSDALGAARSG
ncbi:dTDP-4-dehydrorhamnose reductase [Gordonia humi]|uniref:dTDP-4-dehydrorhamnose reductase n=1 Tax=Gordonia humi TaxID=686429 RepID=A0A840ESC7_9ACTN|nr:dTDP-4-dehydrorhamnose reductase [Gordonia humi]